jgi:hypothetical protein
MDDLFLIHISTLKFSNLNTKLGELLRHSVYIHFSKCRQARRTRSEVTLLWKNNLPIMVEVMLLPDCCYSDDGLTTDGVDLNDPAIKQDALLLERWTLEPVPRQ